MECGGPLPEGWGHVGWPVNVDDVLARTRRGLPSYWPTHPVAIDQRPYVEFAAARGPNSQ
jgi:hypothetical protein